ncbi:hypothetical protein [Ruegeria atlantica]|uniref:hypothetical protein n=1 Tax=Ruegeria atlantica TaxID=81569 RepID=UPI001F2D0490|nr:hypothetical protein [Ruegeria atlantica]
MVDACWAQRMTLHLFGCADFGDGFKEHEDFAPEGFVFSRGFKECRQRKGFAPSACRPTLRIFLAR